MAMIQITVEFCAPEGLEQGKQVTNLEIPEGTPVKDFIALLVQRYGKKVEEKILQPDGVTPYVDFIVNGKAVSLEYVLQSGDEVLVLPPVFFGG